MCPHRLPPKPTCTWVFVLASPPPSIDRGTSKSPWYPAELVILVYIIWKSIAKSNSYWLFGYLNDIYSATGLLAILYRFFWNYNEFQLEGRRWNCNPPIGQPGLPNLLPDGIGKQCGKLQTIKIKHLASSHWQNWFYKGQSKFYLLYGMLSDQLAKAVQSQPGQYGRKWTVRHFHSGSEPEHGR